MDHPQNNIQLECQLLRSRVTELENRFEQVAEDRAVKESTLAINAAQLAALMDHPEKSFELECQILRSRVAELEKKVVQVEKQQALREAALAIKPFEMAEAETKCMQLHQLGLCKEDFDRMYEQIKMQETRLARKTEFYEDAIQELQGQFKSCKKAMRFKSLEV